MKNALVLSGGGARAAYQVGVLQALAELMPAKVENPFPIICGTSAGAINALALASHPGQFRESVQDLVHIWQNLTVDQVYKNSLGDLVKGVGKIGLSLFNEGVGRNQPLALLDNSPLHQLIHEKITFKHIAPAIAAGHLDAVCVTAMGYSSGESVSFFQGRPELAGWRRYHRIGTPTQLDARHLLASSAIPTIFPTVRINREYFGDGAVRQLAPISPALHLGADRVFVVGVSGNRNPEHWGKRRPVRHSPSIAQILGHLFNAAFVDSMESDIEHLERVNRLLAMVPEDQREAAGLPLRTVDSLIISPSQELDKIAGRKVRYLPKALRWFFSSTGATAKGGGATAASYLLFAPEFCSELIELGYQDTMWEADAVRRFFGFAP
ncbi:patatin-like phospholipase family protein [Simiduia sp. 21SJ11W-1]|uniref:patatin-like phospholipase family protein n=1 Tax=Simiduia sp. 21SJ11W-1 TaxID=2909669 RepID=UPI00209CCB16|nr:patatin-like phospholipase family protein [Simiduia sp. 21SJ11W-1]UTA49251.1 patatin-like phospholipase family protein [Simiduia sp. 21SJ11W-1]